MSRAARSILLGIVPVLALLLAGLGFATARTNYLGWFLVVTGLVFAAGVMVTYFVRGIRFWESQGNGAVLQEERGDRSFWLISLSLAIAMFLPPIEALMEAKLSPAPGMTAGGAILVAAGGALFMWARLTLRQGYSGQLVVKSGQALVQTGPYRYIRHPAYAGYLLIVLGISLGYASMWGGAAIFILLAPCLTYRIGVEETILARQFGAEYRAYSRRTKRFIPGVL